MHKFSDTTTSERVIEVDVIAINGVDEREVEEVKINKVEKAEEPTSRYVYIHQSHSPSDMEEQVELYMAPDTNVVNEIA